MSPDIGRPSSRHLPLFVVDYAIRAWYNGRTGIVVGIDGVQISVMVDEHPADMHCTTFYAEELECEAAVRVEEEPS